MGLEERLLNPLRKITNKISRNGLFKDIRNSLVPISLGLAPLATSTFISGCGNENPASPTYEDPGDDNPPSSVIATQGLTDSTGRVTFQEPDGTPQTFFARNKISGIPIPNTKVEMLYVNTSEQKFKFLRVYPPESSGLSSTIELLPLDTLGLRSNEYWLNLVTDFIHEKVGIDPETLEDLLEFTVGKVQNCYSYPKYFGTYQGYPELVNIVRGQGKIALRIAKGVSPGDYSVSILSTLDDHLSNEDLMQFLASFGTNLRFDGYSLDPFATVLPDRNEFLDLFVNSQAPAGSILGVSILGNNGTVDAQLEDYTKYGDTSVKDQTTRCLPFRVDVTNLITRVSDGLVVARDEPIGSLQLYVNEERSKETGTLTAPLTHGSLQSGAYNLVLQLTDRAGNTYITAPHGFTISGTPSDSLKIVNTWTLPEKAGYYPYGLDVAGDNFFTIYNDGINDGLDLTKIVEFDGPPFSSITQNYYPVPPAETNSIQGKADLAVSATTFFVANRTKDRNERVQRDGVTYLGYTSSNFDAGYVNEVQGIATRGSLLYEIYHNSDLTELIVSNGMNSPWTLSTPETTQESNAKLAFRPNGHLLAYCFGNVDGVTKRSIYEYGTPEEGFPLIKRWKLGSFPASSDVDRARAGFGVDSSNDIYFQEAGKVYQLAE